MGIFGKKRAEPAFPWDVELPAIDLARRYDLYYRFHEGSVLIYRNVRIKEKRAVFAGARHGIGDKVWLVEQEDGKEFYLSEFGILLLCESGTEPRFEVRRLAP